MSLTLVSRENILPFTLSDLKLFLRVTHNDEDAFLTRLIQNARNYIELATGEAITEATYLELFQLTSDDLNLMPSRVNAKQVTLVEYLNASSVWTTIAGAFGLKVGAVPAVFEFIPKTSDELSELDEDFQTFFADLSPLSSDSAFNIRVTYKAGAVSVDEIEGHIVETAYQYCGFYYENRQAMADPDFLIKNATFNRKVHVL